jgi:hypothetical protein
MKGADVDVTANPARLNTERVDQTRRGFAQLRDEISAWITRRRRKDVLRQHVTQLNTLEYQFGFVLTEIERGLGDISLSPPPWQAYADCRKADRRLLWMRRLWSYFQSKFDQRDADDAALKNILAAADDAIWSCYVQPFRNAQRATPPAPLPYVASFYSPSAVLRDEPPQDLRSDVDADFLGDMLRQIPIPLVALPPNCSQEPWWLAYIAHEVGHHVQADFLSDARLIEIFADVLTEAGGERWTAWSQEIFADVFSLLAIGHWALWALTELVWGPAASMLDDGSIRYPSPLVRLLLMRAVADKLGLDGSYALRGMKQEDFLGSEPVVSSKTRRDLRDAAKADITRIDAVATAVLGDLPGVGKLKDLMVFRAGDFVPCTGSVHLWAKALVGGDQMVPTNELRDARLVLAGGVQAWATASIGDTAERACARALLRAALPKGILANREEITRAVPLPEQIDLTAHNNNLARLLLADERGHSGA